MSNSLSIKTWALHMLGGTLGLLAGVYGSFHTLFFFGNLFWGSSFSQIAWLFVSPAALVGLTVGAAWGAWSIYKWPKLFSATVLPLAAWSSCLVVLRHVDRPHNYSLRVDGTPNAEFVGFIDVDGQKESVADSIPASYELRGERVEYVVTLTSQDKEHNIHVNILADGIPWDGDEHTDVTTGERRVLKSFGYTEYFGGTVRWWQRLSTSEAEHFLKTGEYQPDFEWPDPF